MANSATLKEHPNSKCRPKEAPVEKARRIPQQMASSSALYTKRFTLKPGDLEIDMNTKSKIALLKKNTISKSNRSLIKSMVSLDLQRKMKCLVANDEPMQLMALKVLLEQADFKVTTA